MPPLILTACLFLPPGLELPPLADVQRFPTLAVTNGHIPLPHRPPLIIALRLDLEPHRRDQ